MDIKVKYFKSTLNELSNNILNYIDIIDYPDSERLFNLEQNTGYASISSSYLNGLVNYVKPLYLICFQKHCNDEQFDEVIKYLQNIDINRLPNEWYHTDFSKLNDNVYYLGEIETSYVIFKYDIDCSECMIIRINKNDFCFEDVKEAMLKIAYNESYYYNESHYYNDINHYYRYIELPDPKGWIQG